MKCVLPTLHAGRVIVFLGVALVSGALLVAPPAVAGSRARRPAPTPTPNAPIVIPFQIISASRAAAILRGVYPDARITVDGHANAVIVVASGFDEQGMRTIASGIDTKNPTAAAVDTYQLKVLKPQVAGERLQSVFPRARILVAPNRTIIIMAAPADMSQIKAIVTAIDTAPPTPTPKPQYPAEAVRVTQRNVKQLARAVANESPHLKVAISGSEILLSGPPDEVDHAKQLVAELDVPQMGTQYTQVYRLKYIDASSVAELFGRSFPNLPLAVDTDLNAITVTSNLTVQRRIADAVSQLDVPPPGAPGGGENGGPASSGIEVVELRAAVPGLQGGTSTTATDIASTVTQALQGRRTTSTSSCRPTQRSSFLREVPTASSSPKSSLRNSIVPRRWSPWTLKCSRSTKARSSSSVFSFPLPRSARHSRRCRQSIRREHQSGRWRANSVPQLLSADSQSDLVYR